jgi:flagellar basal-body rod protein FlgF/flagellar basal-body rod protein FlgG
MEVLAHNLANVDTAGFKRVLGVVQARHAEAIEQGTDYPGSRSINDIGGGVYLAETKTQFSPGVVKPTGVPTHMAIDGDGFFVVEEDGRTYLTRAGNFELTSEGQLVTSSGHAVLSDDREPIRIDTNLPWRLDETGVIVQGGTRISVALEKPASLGDLVPRGRNVFEPIAEPVPVRSEERRVRGGYLEHANVEPALEMIELIEASRAFEANVKLIQNQDHMMGTLVGRLLRSQ